MIRHWLWALMKPRRSWETGFLGSRKLTVIRHRLWTVLKPCKSGVQGPARRIEALQTWSPGPWKDNGDKTPVVDLTEVLQICCSGLLGRTLAVVRHRLWGLLDSKPCKCGVQGFLGTLCTIQFRPLAAWAEESEKLCQLKVSGVWAEESEHDLARSTLWGD